MLIPFLMMLFLLKQSNTWLPNFKVKMMNKIPSKDFNIVGRPGFDSLAKSTKRLLKSWYSKLSCLSSAFKRVSCGDRPASSFVVSLGMALNG